MKLNQAKHIAASKVIVYGPPKAGKTQIAGELAARGFSLIWIDMENGYETLFKLPQEVQEKIELVHLPDTRDYPIAIETCLKITKQKASICHEHGKVDCMLCKKDETATVKALDPEDVEGCKDEVHGRYFTDLDLRNLGPKDIVVFDSGTQLANSCIAHITKDQPDTYKPTYDDWGNMGKLLDVFYSRIQNAPYNVVMLTHEAEVELPGKKTKLVPMGGTRNFSRNVAKYFGHVVHLETKNKAHTAASSSTFMTTILTGSRTDISIENLAELSLAQFFDPSIHIKAKSAGASIGGSTTPTANAASSLLARMANKTAGK